LNSHGLVAHMVLSHARLPVPTRPRKALAFYQKWGDLAKVEKETYLFHADLVSKVLSQMRAVQCLEEFAVIRHLQV
jgi:hypothetical protein